MAKKTRTPAVAPKAGYSPGYTWILLFSFLAVMGGCIVHYLELSADYDMEAEPKGAVSVPKPEPLPPLDTSTWKVALSRGPANLSDDVAVVTPVIAPELQESPAPEPARRMIGPVVVRIPSVLSDITPR